MLARGEAMLIAGLPEDAARASYLANFHMAQALIFEKAEKVPRTHRGVQSEFARLTKDELDTRKDVRATLSRSYDFKAFADYFSGPIVSIGSEEAAQALAAARLFIACLATIIERPDDRS